MRARLVVSLLLAAVMVVPFAQATANENPCDESGGNVTCTVGGYTVGPIDTGCIHPLVPRIRIRVTVTEGWVRVGTSPASNTPNVTSDDILQGCNPGP